MPTFPPETLQFLTDLEANNNKSWFDANRARYDRYYVQVGREFLDALSTRLGLPGKRMRIFKDVRFSKDKTPYKPHLDVWFAESLGPSSGAAEGSGEWGPGLFARLRPTEFLVGMGCHAFEKAALEGYRKGVASDGDALRAALKGLKVGGSTLKRMPKGYGEDPLLLHTALHVEQVGPVPDDAVAVVMDAATRFGPVNAWLKRHMAGSA